MTDISSLVNLIGDIPKEIMGKDKRYLIRYFAYRFQNSFNYMHLKKYKNIEAYLNSLLTDTKRNLTKDRLWCLLMLYVLKDFAKLEDLNLMQTSLDNLIANIDVIEPKRMIKYINELDFIFIVFRKNTCLISLPSENFSDKAFLKEEWDRLYKVVCKYFTEESFNKCALKVYFNHLNQSKDFGFMSKIGFFTDYILINIVLKFEGSVKKVQEELEDICYSTILEDKNIDLFIENLINISFNSFDKKQVKKY